MAIAKPVEDLVNERAPFERPAHIFVGDQSDVRVRIAGAEVAESRERCHDVAKVAPRDHHDARPAGPIHGLHLTSQTVAAA